MDLTSQQFSGKIAIVSGGGAGIGQAIASRLSESGAAVIIADRNVMNGETAAKVIESRGGLSSFVEMDLGHFEDAKTTVQTAIERFGRLDILINCAAALGARKPMLEVTEVEWEDVLRTNVTGTFLLTQAAVRQMLSQGEGGAIVNILAIQALMPLPTYGAYATSKGALSSLTRALAVELADEGIRVNGVAVGSIYTQSVRDALKVSVAANPNGTVEVPTEIDSSAATLLGRMGRPDEIANVVAFLVSEEASYLTGAIIPADGGRLLSRKPDPFWKHFK